MSAPVRIVGQGKRHARVNNGGELVVAIGDYDKTKFVELETANTVYNYYEPISEKQFVVTGFLAYGDKQVGTTTNATVAIFESGTIDGDVASADDVVFQFEVGQNQSVPFPNIKVLIRHGYYLNAKTDDDDVHLTVIGHYIERLE